MLKHSALIMDLIAIGERTTLLHARLNNAIGIIENARRAKKEVDKRSKLKQPDEKEKENGKPGTCSLIK